MSIIYFIYIYIYIYTRKSFDESLFCISVFVFSYLLDSNACLGFFMIFSSVHISSESSCKRALIDASLYVLLNISIFITSSLSEVFLQRKIKEKPCLCRRDINRCVAQWLTKTSPCRLLLHTTQRNSCVSSA